MHKNKISWDSEQIQYSHKEITMVKKVTIVAKESR